MKMWDVHLQCTSISDHSDWATAISAFNTLILLRNCHGRAQSCSCPVCCAGLWGVDPLRPQVATCKKSNDSYRWRFVRSRVHDFETTKTNFGHMFFEWHAAVPWKRTNSKQIILLDDIGLNQCSRKFTDVMQSDAHGYYEMARSWFADLLASLLPAQSPTCLLLTAASF